MAGSWRDLDLPIKDIFSHDKDGMCNFQLCGSRVWRVPLVQEDEEERAGEGGSEEYENLSEIFLSLTFCFLLRTCVFLRLPYISAAQLQEWSMRKRVTYRASPEYGLISIFHSVKNAYFITPHSQPISRNAKCSLVVPRPLRRVGLFLRE